MMTFKPDIMALKLFVLHRGFQLRHNEPDLVEVPVQNVTFFEALPRSSVFA